MRWVQRDRRAQWVVTMATAAVSIGLPGCSDGDATIASGEGSLCMDVLESQRACGFITEGRLSCIDTRFFGIPSPPDVASLRQGTGNSSFNRNLRCIYECLMEFTCDDWRNLVTEEIGCPATVRGAHSQSRCLGECYLATFPCVVGPGVSVTRPPQACDGGAFCAEETDEVGCNYRLCGGDGTPNRFEQEPPQDRAECGEDAFECRDGRLVDARFVCDGQTRNCSEGEDELNCPDNFYCNDGTFVRADAVCNRTPDCPSAIDEEGCAEYLEICD